VTLTGLLKLTQRFGEDLKSTTPKKTGAKRARTGVSENPSDGFISAPADRKTLLRVKIRNNKSTIVPKTKRRTSSRLKRKRDQETSDNETCVVPDG
jgi:hypothetical protein